MVGQSLSQSSCPLCPSFKTLAFYEYGYTKEAIQLGEENFQVGRFSPVSDDVYFGALGDAFHRLGEYDKAWQTYLAGAETVAKHYKKEFGDPDMQFGLRNIEKVRTYFESRTSPDHDQP